MNFLQPLTRDDPRSLGGYAILGRLGAGATGVVYLGRSRGARLCAVKVLHRGLGKEARARFAREVEIASRAGQVHGPVVVARNLSRGWALRPKRLWMASPFLPAVTLFDAVAEHGPLPQGCRGGPVRAPRRGARIAA